MTVLTSDSDCVCNMPMYYVLNAKIRLLFETNILNLVITRRNIGEKIIICIIRLVF